MATQILNQNFRLVSDHFRPWIRNAKLADKTLTDGPNPNALTDGEWLLPSGNGEVYVRATTIGSVGNQVAQGRIPLVCYGERGRSDTATLGAVPVVWHGPYEAETRIFDAAVVVGAGLAITTLDQPLKVATITIEGRNYSGLCGSQTSDTTAVIVGYVTKLPDNNGGWLKFRGRSF